MDLIDKSTLIDSDDGLVASSKKSLPEEMLANISEVLWHYYAKMN